jgi:hypothetical protein
MAAATASTGHLNGAFLRSSRSFLVEDIERGQTHVGDLFFAEGDLMIG